MTKHGTIPQQMCTGKVALEAGVVKALMCAASQAIPTELRAETAEWWNHLGRGKVLADAIGDTIHRPPTLANKLVHWRRFYVSVFDLDMPDVTAGKAKLDCDQLADDYVIIGDDAGTAISANKLWRKFPNIFSAESHLLFRSSGHGAWQLFRNVSPQHHAYNWHLVQMRPRDNRATDFECPNEDEQGILFRELFVQQLFCYWSGQPLVENRWLYSEGSRTAIGTVPAIMWSKSKMFIGSFPRKTIRRNVEYYGHMCSLD